VDVLLIAAIPTHVNVVSRNLDTPGERGRLSGVALWHCAGLKAVNTAHTLAIADGCEWVVHLDDDDVWDADHLYWLLAGIEFMPSAVLVHTQSQYIHRLKFPVLSNDQAVVCNATKLPSNVIRSSVAIHVAILAPEHTLYSYSDTAADAHMWARLQRLGCVVQVPVQTVQTVYHLQV
jgi:hypothetical protein